MRPRFTVNWFIVVLTLIRPPDGVAGHIVAHNVFVFRRAPSKDTSVYCHCTTTGYLAFIVAGKIFTSFLFKKELIRRVVIYFGDVCNAILAQIQVSHTKDSCGSCLSSKKKDLANSVQ